jgi:hypothetical protein
MTTPLQLTVTAGMLQNQGIQPNANGLTAISTYESAQPVSDWLTAINKALSIQILPDSPVTSNAQTRMSAATIGRMANIGTTTIPALGDSLPSNISGVTLLTLTAPGLSNYARISAQQIANVNDLSTFCSAFDSALGYVVSTNQVINTNLNVNSYLGPTFTNMNDLITGGLSSLTLDLQRFGKDAQRLGSVIGLQDLDQLGSPAQLMLQLINAGGIPEGVSARLAAQGVLDAVERLTAPDAEMSDSEQARVYAVMKEVTGEDLVNVLEILDCSQTGVSSMADLLNPAKLFADSFLTLICPLPSNTQKIYIDQTGSVNTNILPELPEYLVDAASPGMPFDRLRLIIPQDQALANKALQLALQQIGGIDDLTVPGLGATALVLETDQGLPAVQALTEPASNSVVQFIQDQVAIGSGPNGTLTVFDVIGTAAGYKITDTLGNVTTSMLTLDTSVLANVYQVMTGVMNGAYNVYDESNPNDWQGINTPYGVFPPNYNTAVTSLCNTANAQISSIQVSNPVTVAVLNQQYYDFAEQMAIQLTNQARGSLDIANLTPQNRSAVYSFATSLPEYAIDRVANNYLLLVIDSSNLTGQSILAGLREGRNLAALNQVGVRTVNEIPSTPK